ncbi:stage II sporulation protein M [Geothrix sp. PMB-07]|uniref:stage II sporulation protein M n=1 Tax=Geothrix sp. PMB-07 TaxID=3068640 RepID=UPI0027412B98|nr:stage II sporulation protein M [Geothrix sp. PMB-07]WLT31945.1 stage II sporulation protein M [Geothrix sp. PMB-07]
MRQQLFEQQHRPLWENLLGWVEDRPTLGVEDAPSSYRQLCHHLAVARERHYSPALVERLQQLALRVHQKLYGERGEGLLSAWRFLWHDLPRQVREEWRLVAVSSLLFFGTWIAAFLLVRAHPNLVHLLLSPDEAAKYVQMYDPKTPVAGATGATRDVMMFGYYILNNIGIDFQVFASGLLAGVGPLFFLPFNGLHGGTVMAHLTNHGLTATFYGFISGHSSFELIGVVLSGTGGLRMGIAFMHPGRRSRLAALKDGARRGSRLLFGAAILTFIAACFEGFWSANTLVPWKAKVALGLLFWVLLCLWLLLAGRRRP